MSFGTELAICRKRRNLGQTQLARLMGMSRSFITKLEADKKRPNLQFLDRLQATLALDAEEFQHLSKALALGRRRLVLGDHLDGERVEIIHLFVDRIQGLECAPLRALLEAMPTR